MTRKKYFYFQRIGKNIEQSFSIGESWLQKLRKPLAATGILVDRAKFLDKKLSGHQKEERRKDVRLYYYLYGAALLSDPSGNRSD